MPRVVLHDGRGAGVYRKQLPAQLRCLRREPLSSRPGTRSWCLPTARLCLGVSICEDIWHPDGPSAGAGGPRRCRHPVNISASPYHAGKVRSANACSPRAPRTTSPSLLIEPGRRAGRAGVRRPEPGLDEPEGHVIARAEQFEEDLLVADLDVAARYSARGCYDRRPGSSR